MSFTANFLRRKFNRPGNLKTKCYYRHCSRYYKAQISNRISFRHITSYSINRSSRLNRISPKHIPPS
ncbi:hypothetical protein ERO13_D04G127500v2 [Gossypium hirsutum]|uniref:Uncharacterized protein n=2 Tax=Gossypium TaxID=3633 RepID=A0A5J5S0A4_GOSBA|nr:hypothetical protein ES319_D04G147000v1 [Gossypium barbadense]KAG4152523.1 hypothetical protein ERO13_D04G127500v2 [Gossypium hirsutum]TYI87639.1 hypothetical protein E1A91_D04G149400v1 [Gossypium mustelinum]